MSIELLSGQHVLIVDDRPDNLTVLDMLLDFHGAKVTAATAGDKCLELLAAQSFDLVLLDIQMPRVSGWDVIRAIRADPDPKRRSTLVIAVTAHAMPGDREKCLEAGFDSYVSKPFDVPVLLTVIADLLAQSRSRQEPPLSVAIAPTTAPHNEEIPNV